MTGLPPNIRAATERWIAEVVIAQAFCPFAEVPFAAEDVLLEYLPPGTKDALQTVVRRAAQMASAPLPETTLLISPEALDALDDFLAFQELAEELIEEAFPGAYVTASFHPDYRFADAPAGAVVHEIHRSPFPTLQLLRKPSVAFAKTRHDTNALLRRNREHAENLGKGFFDQFHV